LLKELDTSLSELKTDYVDIWYLHSKSEPSEIRDDMIEASTSQSSKANPIHWHEHHALPS